MKITKMLTILVLAWGLILWQPGVSKAAPMGTAFTYKGHLYDANYAANDLYDFAFKLYDAGAGGSKLGSDANMADVNVIDAYFTVELDFGGGVFDGNAVWLEIGVRPGNMDDPNGYTILTPRQEIMAVPYALYALNGSGGGADSDWTISGSDMYSGVSGNVGVGTAGPVDKLDVAGHINSSASYKLDGQTVVSNVGPENILLGRGAGGSVTTGGRNTAVGYEAFNLSNTGYFNSAVGYRALYSDTTGFYNSAMGYGALYFNTTGYENSAMGMSALYSNTTGWDNSAVGSHALYFNSTGVQNSAVGYRAGYNNSTGSGNVFLGYEAGCNEAGSNKLYIANSSANPPLIYGEFNTGRVGLGTTVPSERLDVTGNAKFTGNLKVSGSYIDSSADSGTSGQILSSTGAGTNWIDAPSGGADSDWTISGSDMYSSVSGNIGIGTALPVDKLDVMGHINSSESYKLDGQTVVSNAGTENIFIGGDAGENVTTGSFNSAVGNSVLYSNTTGNYNSAVGTFALYSNTTGYSNSAVGYYALSFNTTGYLNSAVGMAALYHNTTGFQNSAVGYGALWANTTGYYNSAIGNLALYRNTTGYLNSAVGNNALFSNTTGANNSAVGNYALSGNTTGNYNAAMGTNALRYNTTGTDNSAVGYYALYFNDEGRFNSALGSYALYSNTTGGFNSAVGYEALMSNTGSQNSAMGFRALRSNTTGNYNSALGSYALTSNTTGYNNSAVGMNVLYSNTTGYENSAVGDYTLYSNSTGYDNTAMGHSALYSNTTGGFNSAVGESALISNTTGSDNAAVGNEALGANTAGNYNVAVGYEAGNDSKGSGNVFLGCQAGYHETGSDKLYIENSSISTPLIYGDFAANRIGINRVATTNTLEVGGDASKATAGSWLANSDERIKADIQTVTGALDRLDKVRLVSFKYRDDYQAEHPGIEKRRYLNVIAQEFQEVFPEYVKGSGEKLANGEEILQVDSYPLTVYSAAAVQELHTIVKAKDAEIAALNERLAKMEAAVSKLIRSEQGGQ